MPVDPDLKIQMEKYMPEVAGDDAFPYVVLATLQVPPLK